MKKARWITALLCAALMTFGFASCTSVEPVSVGSGKIGNKRGEASGIWLFGVMPIKADTGTEKAARSAGITKVATVDVKTTVILFGLVVKKTTIVTGEEDDSDIAFKNSEVTVSGNSVVFDTDSDIPYSNENIDEDIVIINGTNDPTFFCNDRFSASRFLFMGNSWNTGIEWTEFKSSD